MDSNILKIIRHIVFSYVDKAEIFLFGSRARGNNKENSDWDILVLVEDNVLKTVRNSIDHDIWDKGLDYGAEINTIVRCKTDWKENCSMLKHHILEEGIRI